MSASSNRRARAARSLAVAAALAAFAIGQPASGHFLWIEAERQPDSSVAVRAFFAEPPVPDLPEFLKYIAEATYSADGRPLPARRGEEAYLVEIPGPAPRVIDGAVEFGLMSRGGATFLLTYTGRAQLGPVPADAPERPDGLRVRLVEGGEGPPSVRVTFEGRPAAGAVVKIFSEDGDDREVTADDLGRIDCPEAAEGRAGLLAKWFDGTAGERDGAPYEETRHYATLIVTPADAPEESPDVTRASADPRPYPPLPEPLNSFGGAVSGHHLYVYSGHTGTTHRYHTGTTNPHFYRLDLRGGSGWEELPCGPSLQGVALVAHGGMLYRVGGMLARNAEGEPHDLVSVAEVAKFDPETRTWTDLPPLPEPRSTHDAAVLGDHLYVVGGWSMPGGDADEAAFLDDALRLDLADPDSGWEELPPPPTVRRALAVASEGGRLYVLGGLLEGGQTTRAVDVFDPKLGTWTSGPDLPGPPIQGFAPSAFGVGGRLYANGGDGTVYRLSGSGGSWEAIAELAVPRITHRLLPGIERDLLIVGGNFLGIPVPFVESVPIDGGGDGPRAVSWSAGLLDEAVQSQAVGVFGAKLVIAGGNRGVDPHDFEAANLSADVFEVRLDGAPAASAGPLPEPRQSGVLIGVPEGGRRVAYHLGGLGPDGEVVRSLGSVFRREVDGSSWSRLDAEIPDDRGMFGAAEHGGAIWIFGGSVYDPRPGAAGGSFPTEVLRWDPGAAGGSFATTGHRIPRPRRSFAGAAFGGKYYMVGGLGDDQEPVGEVDVFDFESGRWETAPAPARHRVFADLAVLGGRLYLGGGFSRGSSGHFEAERSIEVYDPEARSWTVAMAEAPIAARGLRLMAAGGRLLLFGIDPGDRRRARVALVAPGGAPAPPLATAGGRASGDAADQLGSTR